MRHRNGSYRWIGHACRPVFSGGEYLGIRGSNRDITDRKRAEDELKRLSATLEHRVAERTAELSQANERFRAIAESNLVGILTLNERGRVQTFNPAAMAIFGYAPPEMVGCSIDSLLAFPHQAKEGSFIAHFNQPGVGRPVTGEREVLGKCKDGRVLMLSVTLGEFEHGGRREIVAMVRNITERKRLERELFEVGDRERQQLGHDLHDGLGQHLHALYYMASLMEREIRATSSQQAGEVGRLTLQLKHALELSRSLARGLQPVNNLPEGLMAALRELAGRTRELYRVDCRLQCRVPVLIHRHAAANHLYRIAQEAVSNAMKHGKPSRVRIKLAASPQRIILGVSDNGVGIRQYRGSAHGMGLHVMQYRADAIGGSLVIQRQEKGGTEVVCTVARQALASQEDNQK